MRKSPTFFSLDIFATSAFGLTAGCVTAFFVNSKMVFQQFGVEALPYILLQNELILCIVALFSFFWLIQDLALFSNFFLQCYFISSAFSSFGFSFPVLATLMFSAIESSLLVAVAIKTRKHKKPLIRYLPIFMLLMALSAVLEVIIL